MYVLLVNETNIDLLYGLHKSIIRKTDNFPTGGTPIPNRFCYLILIIKLRSLKFYFVPNSFGFDWNILGKDYAS